MTDAHRGTAHERGYTSDGHRSFRDEVLWRDRFTCCMCGRAADVADHYPRSRKELIAAGENPDDPAFGRALCTTCHNRHTGHTEGRDNLRRDRH
ncbi:hypothetical protein [Gordonia sp. N1V]|uniref:hypothetical protein n=1 Tax=Gordonia sp. N1V TaxID=3034163 RepID=UPI0023E0F7DD|nr:hypothetical protein [Gordonia sp. N1V]MDF3280908.1 hypothetical protein [Gordonia sp. N1V]